MALIHVDFYAETLELGTSMTVVLPQEGDSPPPLLYLLHGLTDDHTAWTRYTSIERYAYDHRIAVVMPQVHRSFYADEAYGMKFWTFLSDELPRVVNRFFNVSQKREDTFVAGLSMGGYGAFKWALRQPDRFAAAASLSGALDVAARLYQPPRSEDPLMWDRILGGRPITDTADDLFHLLATVEQPPPLYLCCGTDDVVYEDNVRFADACRQRGVPLETQLGPGAHEWAYWDAKIQDVLAWLPLRTS